jgi:hypothetical protein
MTRKPLKEFGQLITVDPNKYKIDGSVNNCWFAKVNWGCQGPTNFRGTKRFINNLQRALDFCRKLRGK